MPSLSCEVIFVREEEEEEEVVEEEEENDAVVEEVGYGAEAVDAEAVDAEAGDWEVLEGMAERLTEEMPLGKGAVVS